MTTTLTERLDVMRIREDFPVLKREVAPGVPLVYLDSTATSQKPLAVIRAMNDYYERSNANIHRGVHTLAEEATAQYEAAREKIAEFIGVRPKRLIWLHSAGGVNFYNAATGFC